VTRETDDVALARLRSTSLNWERLGGHLARASYPPPGNTVIWRGLARLTDIEFGAGIRAVRFVGD